MHFIKKAYSIRNAYEQISLKKKIQKTKHYI